MSHPKMNIIKRTLFLVLSGLVLVGCNVAFGATPVESLLPSRLPEGWTVIEGPRLYNKKTLFEHIDGQAELYLKYGYQRSVFASYQDRKRSESQIELDLYDMGNVLQAFGVFSRFRTADQPGGVGLDSYLDDRSLLFYKGRYFVMVYANEADPPLLKEWALAVSSRISDAAPAPREIGYFPAKGLKPGSIQYFSEGLLGHRFLKKGFQGTYITEEKGRPADQQKETHLFMAIFKNTEETKSALKIYRDYLAGKGKVQSIPKGFGPHAFGGEDPYKGKVLVAQKGLYLLGTVGFEREKEAEDRLLEMAKNVK
jgi:hypothetical protein